MAKTCVNCTSSLGGAHSRCISCHQFSNFEKMSGTRISASDIGQRVHLAELMNNERQVYKDTVLAEMYGNFLGHETKARHFDAPVNVRVQKSASLAFYPGRRNAYDQGCACCHLMVSAGEGHLAKTDEGSSLWLVICDVCKEADAPIKLAGASATIKLRNKSENPSEIQRAGDAYFASMTRDSVEPKGDSPLAGLNPLVDAYFANLTRDNTTDIFRHLYLQDVPESATLVERIIPIREVYKDLYDEIKPRDLYRKLYGRIFEETFWPAPNGLKPSLPPATSHDWGAFVDGTSIRDTSFAAGWGEQVPSRERVHKSKRPRRR